MKGKKETPAEREASSKSNDTLFKKSAQKKRSKRTNNVSLQKNAKFLNDHLDVFTRKGSQTGDGDSFFKKSLRLYEEPVKKNSLKWLYSELGGESETNLTFVPFSKVSVHSTSEENLQSVDKHSANESASSSSKSIITIMDPEGMGEEDEEYYEDDEAKFTSEDEAGNEDEQYEDEVNKVQNEIDEVVEQNPELEEASNAEDRRSAKDNQEKQDATVAPKQQKPPDAGGKPGDDGDIIKKLEAAEANAIETSKAINEIKERLMELQKIDKMSAEESQELDEKNQLLQKLMKQFDDQTQLIERLMQEANISGGDREGNADEEGEDLPEKKLPEDSLPKVIICGPTESNMPKIIVCEAEKMRKERKSSLTLPSPTSPTGIVPKIAKRLSDSYSMQEKLAAENADLEGKRYQLQEDLLNKDQTVESLQRKLCGLQAEMRIVLKENSNLNNKLQVKEKKSKSRSKMSCGGKRTICPADVENRLMEYSNTTQFLEQQMGLMEQEMRNMQTELQNVQRERQQLRNRCGPPPRPPCPAPCAPRPCEQQLRELREQYNRLQDDFKAKLTEVAGLRADTERWKTAAAQAEEAKKAAEDKLRNVDRDMKSFKTEKDKLLGSKELLLEQEQQLTVAKQRFREAQDELEELRALIQDQAGQLEDYRNKYLQAQQQVDEQRRQIDLMELENSRIAEQVNLEISRVKNQFQEKLQELTPLPDILKTTQLKLQEAQQMHILAERNNETMMREVHAQREKVQVLQAQLDKFMDDAASGADSQGQIMSKMEQYEAKMAELQRENEQLKADLIRMEEVADQNEKRIQEKMHEIAQLVSQLDMVREESARQVARTKDRCETVRRSMQNQISDLERQLAQSRAAACSAQKERDDIRQKMQMQINNLNDNFEEAQIRIRNLQGHVNFLKTSYTNIFPAGEGPGQIPLLPDESDPCNCGNNY